MLPPLTDMHSFVGASSAPAVFAALEDTEPTTLCNALRQARATKNKPQVSKGGSPSCGTGWVRPGDAPSPSPPSTRYHSIWCRLETIQEFALSTLVDIAHQIAEGLCWLHAHGVALGSLHAEAIIYRRVGGCKASCMNRNPQFSSEVLMVWVPGGGGKARSSQCCWRFRAVSSAILPDGWLRKMRTFPLTVLLHCKLRD
jgi:hypothetical protein